MKQLCLICILLFGACGSKQPAQETKPVEPANTDDPSCPLVVPGTALSVEDTATGAALVFVTTGDAAAVRARAITLAAMHTKHNGPSGAMGMMFSPGSKATASDVEGGARIEFVPAQPDGAAALQAELRMHAGHLTGGSCEM